MRRVTLEELRSIAAAIKERPMLFSTPMVQAIREDRKTMTRRTAGLKLINESPDDWTDIFLGKDGKWYAECEAWEGNHLQEVKCRYGQVGDILWVRERWMKGYEVDEEMEEAKPSRYYYAADKDWQHIHWCYDDREEDTGEARWKPSIHMPREACRLRLLITDLKVERLQDISGDDVLKEGVDNGSSNKKMGVRWENMQRMAFQELWQTLNGEESWNLNPWVWVISFVKP